MTLVARHVLHVRSDAIHGRRPLRLVDRLQLHPLRAAGFRSRLVPTSLGDVHALDAPGRGTLPPVLLLHGLGSHAADYGPLLRRLRRHVRRVVALDLPGHGLSAAPAPGTPGRALVSALVEGVDQVVDEPMVVYGNSLGGLAAVLVAGSRPSRVRALVLASPGGAPMTPVDLEAFLGRFRLESHSQAVDFADRCLGERRWFRHAMAWGTRKRFARPEVRALIEGVSPTDLLTPEEVSALRMPILVLWGRNDRVLPDAHRDFFRRHLPCHAVFEEPPGYGHAPQLDAPALLTRRVVAWMRAVQPAPALG